MADDLKWPEAQGKADYYQGLVDTLTTDRTDIAALINKAGTVDRAALDPAGVDGVYYDTYIKQMDKWITQQGTEVTTFNTFLADLDVCITNASNLQTQWAGRINVKK